MVSRRWRAGSSKNFRKTSILKLVGDQSIFVEGGD